MENATSNRIVRVLLLSSMVMLVVLAAGIVSAYVWGTETVDSVGDVGDEDYDTSLALDAAGNPHISYFDNTNSDLKYAWRDGTGWHTETVDSAGDLGWYASLALDAAGNPRIGYFDYTNYSLKYAWRDGTGWHCQTVDRGGESVSLELDAAGNPRISYCDSLYDGYIGENRMKYAWHDGMDWHNMTIEVPFGVYDRGNVWFTSLALDGYGNPYISFCGTPDVLSTYSFRLFFTSPNPEGRLTQTVDADQGYVGLYPSLTLDNADRPRISYCAYLDLRYAWRDGTGWHRQTVDAAGDVGWFTSLALDSAGNPRISYFDKTNGDLKYAWHDGTSWYNRTVDSAGDTGWFTSLALDSAGNPCISYYDNTNHDLRFAWAESPLPGVVAVPGGAGVPTSIGGNGKYDDVNGNGRADFADVVLYFNQMSWVAANEPLSAFDYNGNSRIDFADVVWLFNLL